jgi:phage terminase small subunit
MNTPPKREQNEHLLELFCLEYVKDFKGGPAARRAGAPESSARSWASRALARPEVAARIAQLKAERVQRVKADGDDVIEKLTRIAMTDISDLVEFRRCCCRHCWGKGFGYQHTDGALRMARARYAKELKAAQASGADLAEEIKPFDEEGGGGFNATHDPNPECPECHGEGVGVPFMKDTRDLGPGAAAAYAGVKVTKDGIEIKTHDPVRALELLGKHLDLFTDNVKHSGQVTLAGLSDRMRKRGPLA